MELFRLMGRIAIDNSEAKKSIDDTVKQAGDAGEEMNNSVTMIGTGFLKLVGAAGAAGVAMGTALTKAAVSSYASYEQLVGGVETLFKSSSGKVMKYAEDAYKTAGLSSNEYMETVTSFSASLLQGLGGDTAAAAEMANTAIIDMSDNANKMGTSMGMIMNAYQGFAKGNYTMLDNLKLGYGGTQAEMVRLINDSGVLNEKISSMDGIKFDTVIEAIHAVQTEMGITGTTAKEAEETIQGSLAAMKGAWENLLIGIAAGDQDVSALFDQLYDSAMIFAENLIPRIKTTIEGFFQLISDKLPFIEELAVVIGIVTTAVALHNAVQAVRAAMVAAEVSSLGALIAMKIKDAAATMVQLAPYLLIAAAIAAVIAIGVLLYKHWDDIKAKCQELAAKLKETWNNIKSSITETVENIKQTISNVWESIKSAVTSVLETIKTIITTAWNTYKSIITTEINLIKSVVTTVFNAVKTVVTTVFNAVKDAVTSVWTGIKNTISTAINGVKSSISSGLNGAKDTVSNVLDAIKSKFTSIWNGVKNTVSSAIDKVKNMMNFSWKLPKPKIPKFNVSGGKAPWGFGGKGSLPKVDIKWHASAMNAPMLMDKPTIFGYNPLSGQFLGGGEAGSEMVGGTNTIMNMISAAVERQNAGMQTILQRILEAIMSMDANMLHNISAAMDNKKILWNDRELGRLVNKYA